MRLQWSEIRARAAAFSERHKQARYEKGETQTFYNEFFDCFGVNRRQVDERHARSLRGQLAGREPVLLDEALPQGNRHGVRPGAGSELAEDVMDVRLDRLAGEEETAGDLVVEQPLRHERDDLHLAR